MTKGFEFEHEGRHYICTIEARHGAPSDSWWWFSVSGDAQRYAPFRTAKDDTLASVSQRVVKFYADRLFALSQPTERGSHWGKRNNSGAAKAAAVKAAAAKKAAAMRAKTLQAETKALAEKEARKNKAKTRTAKARTKTAKAAKPAKKVAGKAAAKKAPARKKATKPAKKK